MENEFQKRVCKVLEYIKNSGDLVEDSYYRYKDLYQTMKVVDILNGIEHITVIDLLNRIANNKNIPNKIKINGRIAVYDEKTKMYEYEDHDAMEIYTYDTLITPYYFDLYDEVEIVGDSNE